MPRESSELVAKWIKNPKNFLVITGPAGTGKTYFCSSIIDHMVDKFNAIRAYNERELLRRVRNSISDSTNADYMEVLKLLLDDDLIILDDLGSSGYTEWREEILMEAIDYRYREGLPTIMTSNLSKNDFYKIYGQRISSRLFAKENTIINLENEPDKRSFESQEVFVPSEKKP